MSVAQPFSTFAAVLTSEQVLSLAPDPSSAKAGKDLAVARKWVTLGQAGIAVWGQCQGSGKQPYQTQVELAQTAFKCSCPSRKFPCKHGLGLLLLLAEQPALFTEKEQPPWVAEWLLSRSQRTQKAKQRSAEAKLGSTDAAQEKRAQSREKRVRAGLQELEIWLRDLIRGGLATAQGQPYSYWDGIAARMVDAQAPGIARLLRELAGIRVPASPAPSRNASQNTLATREGQMLWQLSRVHLLLQGFARIGELAPEMQAEIRTQIGWTQSQEELSGQAGVRDCWQVLSNRVEEEERLRVSRTWLWGRRSQRFALILQFAHGSTPLTNTLLPGTETKAEVNFFAGAFPLRAIVKERFGEPQTFSATPQGVTIVTAIERYAGALASNPWLGAFPVTLHNVLPVMHDERGAWALREERACDEASDHAPAIQHEIRVIENFSHGWKLLSLSGGRPLTVFGEWDGSSFLPLAAMAGARWCRL